MATENDKQADSGKIEVSGKGWKAYVPVALVVGLLSNSGSFAGCSKQDEVLHEIREVRREVKQQNEKISDINVRVARIEGARGAGSQ